MAFGGEERQPRAIDTDGRGLAVAVASVGFVLAAIIAGHLVDFGVYDLRIDALDANLGSSPVAWFGPVAIFVAFLASLAPANRFPSRVGRALPLLLAIVLLLATRHLGESLPHWQVLLLPPLGLTLVGLWTAAPNLDRWSGRVVRGGCVLLVVAFALHVFGAFVLERLGWGSDSWPFQVKVAFKEATEVGGWMLIATGLVAAARPARPARA
jgi:hypothetical protein